MSRFRWFAIAVLAVFAVGVTVASSASASLPTVLFLSGTTSVLLLGSKTGAGVAVFCTKALVVDAKKIVVELTALTNDTHLGSILLIFLESMDVGTSNACTQAGQAAGTVHVTGEWHLVYVALGTFLKVGLLILVPKTSFVCGEATVSTEGSQLQELAKIPTAETDGTEIEGISKCEGASKETPGLTKYENEAGETVEAKLTSTIAGIKEKTCEELSSGLVLKSSVASQMFKIASVAPGLLPTVLFLSGTTSVLLLGSKTEVEVAVFRTKALVEHAGKIAVELTALANNTHLGSILIVFLELKDAGTGNVCTQAGQAEGVVHLTGEWHLVYVPLGTFLKVGLLILVPKTTLKCGEANVSMEGSQLQELAKIPTGETDGTDIELLSKCEGVEKLTPGLTKYENEAGEAVEASLLSTIAGIKEKTCIELSSGLVLKSSVASQMFKIASVTSGLLPTVLFLSGTTSVLLLGSKAGTGVATFRTKELVEQAGKIAVELTALADDTSSGAVLTIVLEIKDVGTGNTCTQAGQAAGVVHFTGEWHLVYVALGAALKVGLLILVPKTTFVCGEASVSVEGSELEELAKIPTAETDGTEIEAISKCEGAEKLTPGLTKYENEKGESVEAKLTWTFAGIKENVCMELSSGLVLESSAASQMFKIDL